MRRSLSVAATIAGVALVALAGSVAGRVLWDEVFAGEKNDATPPGLSAIDEEYSKERFEGELLDVFVAPPGREVPDEFTAYDDVCGDGPTTQVPSDQAGELDLSVSLPDRFRLEPDSLNTGVIACDGHVYAARWEYSFVQDSGYPGSLVIARSRLQHVEFEASVDRVSIEEIAGQPGVYIRPLAENGVGSAAGVIFRGDSVTTALYSSGIPASDLLEAAEAIAGRLTES